MITMLTVIFLMIEYTIKISIRVFVWIFKAFFAFLRACFWILLLFFGA